MISKGIRHAYILLFFLTKGLTAQHKGEFFDNRDSTIYQWVKIGEQVWMAQNLTYLPKVYPSSEGSGLMEINSLPYQYVYNYEGKDVEEAKLTESFANFGVLYNYTSAINGCPDGWRLPTLEDWKILLIAIGMQENVDDNLGFINEESVAEKLQSPAGLNNYTIRENESAFKVKLGGLRFKGNIFISKEATGFDLQGDAAFFWTATINVQNQSAYRITIEKNKKGVLAYPIVIMNGLSVRCIQE